MISKNIDGATGTYTAPGCTDLRVRVSAYKDTIVCETAWEIMPDEIEMLKNGGSLVLSILGGQPAVSLSVEPPKEEFTPHD